MPRGELITHHREKSDDRREGGRQWRLSGGWIASHVASQPGGAAAIVHGLSDGSSPASRLAFLNIVNLLFWGAARSRMSSGARYSLWQAAEVVLESQQDLLLPKLFANCGAWRRGDTSGQRVPSSQAYTRVRVPEFASGGLLFAYAAVAREGDWCA